MQEHSFTYREAENKNNPRCHFSSVASLTLSQSSIELFNLMAPSGNLSMSFLNNKIQNINEKIKHSCPQVALLHHQTAD